MRARIHAYIQPWNEDSPFNSLLPHHSTEIRHSSPPTFISVDYPGRCVCVRVKENERASVCCPLLFEHLDTRNPHYPFCHI